jgi:RNA polymerase sigma factor (sigma-70 family)
MAPRTAALSLVELSDPPPPDAASDDFDEAFWPLFLAAYRVAFRILRNREAAEDVAAETMARAHVHWPRIVPNRTAWVVRVATNRALDVIRRGPAPVDVPGVRGFEDEAALRLAMATVLSGLPRRQREVVVLRFLVGLAPADVAAALGIGQGSMRRYLDRALRRLRERLGDGPW